MASSLFPARIEFSHPTTLQDIMCPEVRNGGCSAQCSVHGFDWLSNYIATPCERRVQRTVTCHCCHHSTSASTSPPPLACLLCFGSEIHYSSGVSTQPTDVCVRVCVTLCVCAIPSMPSCACLHRQTGIWVSGCWVSPPPCRRPTEPGVEWAVGTVWHGMKVPSICDAARVVVPE